MHDQRRSAFGSLRIRNFRLFFFGQLISQIGSWLTIVALTLIVLRRTDSGVAVGVLVACQYGPMLVLGAYGGLTADRRDKRVLLIVTQSLQLLQSLVLAWLAFMGDAPLGAFFVTAALGGVLMAFDNPARRSFVTEMVPVDQMHNAVTLNSALMTSARVVGPALGGVLVATVGFGWTFIIDALSYVAVIVGYGVMRVAELHQTDRGATGKGQVRAALRYIRAVPDLYVPMVMVTIIGLCSYNFAVMIPLFVVRALHRSDSTYTALYTVLSVGSLAAAVVAARGRSADLSFAVRWAYGFGGALLLLAMAPNLVAAFPAGLALGFASIMFMTGATSIIQVRAEPSMRGRVLALQAVVLLGTNPIGGPLLGQITDWFGARVAVLIGAGGALGAGAWGRGQVIASPRSP